MSKDNTALELIAEPAVVRSLTLHLLKSFEEFMADFDGTLDYVDGFMAAHNFHVRIVENIAEESGQETWFESAALTFANRMFSPGEYDTKNSKNE